MELIHGSETSANYILTPGKYSKEHIQYSNHGKSLKFTIPNGSFVTNGKRNIYSNVKFCKAGLIYITDFIHHCENIRNHAICMSTFVSGTY
jgi:hypothetical protein